jgi:hypothetical protein
LPHHLITEVHLIGAAIGCAILLCMWLGIRWAMRHQEAASDSFTRADRAPIYDGDAYARELARMRRERPMAQAARSSSGAPRLPTQEERTQQLAALRDDSPAPAPRPLPRTRFNPAPAPSPARSRGPMAGSDADTINGKVVRITDVPTYRERASTLVQRLEEYHTDWHWVGGQLHAPTLLTDRLPEGDWLRDLLVSA